MSECPLPEALIGHLGVNGILVQTLHQGSMGRRDQVWVMCACADICSVSIILDDSVWDLDDRSSR